MIQIKMFYSCHLLNVWHKEEKAFKQLLLQSDKPQIWLQPEPMNAEHKTEKTPYCFCRVFSKAFFTLQ